MCAAQWILRAVLATASSFRRGEQVGLKREWQNERRTTVLCESVKIMHPPNAKEGTADVLMADVAVYPDKKCSLVQ